MAFSLTRLRRPDRLLAVASLAVLASLWMPWFGVELPDGLAGLAGVDLSASGWKLLSVLDVVTAASAVLGLVAVGLIATQRSPSIPLLATVVSVWTSGLLLVALTLRLIFQPGADEVIGVRYGAWVALLGVLTMAAAGWWSLRDERTDAAPTVDLPAMPVPPTESGAAPSSPTGPIAADEG